MSRQPAGGLFRAWRASAPPDVEFPPPVGLTCAVAGCHSIVVGSTAEIAEERMVEHLRHVHGR